MNFDIVVACDTECGIAKNGDLPWRLAQDLKYFRKLTSSHTIRQNAVIMGRKTWESIPAKFRPLADRKNIIITRDPNYNLPDGVFKAPSLDYALAQAEKLDCERCFVIGGGQIYKEAIKHQDCQRLFLTQIANAFQCDTFFPDFDGDFVLESCLEPIEEGGTEYCFKVLRKQETVSRRNA